MGADDIEGLDQEIDDFFDFVIIDDDMINNKDKKVQKVLNIHRERSHQQLKKNLK